MGKKGKKPTATNLDAVAEEERVLTLVEVDPATENPALLDAIRYAQSTLAQVLTHSHASSCASPTPKGMARAGDL